MNMCVLPDAERGPEQIKDRGLFISTYSGAEFYVQECNIEDIPIEDIAHALSLNCRFNGHVKKFYSVAEHSVLVSHLVSPKNALWGLMHDVTEAFVPDVPRPFKELITGFNEFEQSLSVKMARHFGLPEQMPDDVMYIDKNVVADEARQLFLSPPDWVSFYDSVYDGVVEGLPPEEAEELFLLRFRELTSE